MFKYSVRLDAFEGPLDLLLHLINQAEVDIYDIPMTKITEQYLEYIHTMRELELDIASEYLVMAATLIAIKSKMLLPKPKEELFDEEYVLDEEDPRQELAYRLIQYRKYKEAAKELQDMETERTFIHTKLPVNLEIFFPQEERKDVTIKGITVLDMLGAYKKMLKRRKLQEPIEKTVKSQEYSIDVRMSEVIDELTNSTGVRTFSSLFSKYEKSYIVITFLAILELMKMNEIQCVQETNFSDIMIFLKREGVRC
jgi:segregation and condensation protein A